jgi:FkbM family methyltransferase
MNLLDKLHMMHRFWRYRLLDERDSIEFLLGQNIINTTAIDIGANRGIYSYWMSKKVGASGKVIAFEPQPELEIHLQELRQSFHLNNLIIENKALSDHCGNDYLYRTEAGSGGATFNEYKGLEKVYIEVTSLDEYFKTKEFPQISFIKCDVEGHEQHVFKGADHILKKCKPILLFECHHEYAKQGNLFSFLTELNYVGYFFYRRQMIDYSQFEKYAYRKPHESHRNYIFIHKCS